MPSPANWFFIPLDRRGRRGEGLKTSPVLPPPAAWVLVLLFGISAWFAVATVATVSAVLAASVAVDDVGANLAS